MAMVHETKCTVATASALMGRCHSCNMRTQTVEKSGDTTSMLPKKIQLKAKSNLAVAGVPALALKSYTRAKPYCCIKLCW